MNGAGLVSAAVVGGISYLLMRKEKMFVQGGRKKHRLCGLVQMLPFPGIINGLLVPTMLVPTCFFALSAQETVIYQFILYWVLSMLLLLFYMKGKSWRSWFHENMQHRSLLKSEKYLLWIIGILMLLFSNHTTRQITVDSGNVRAADSGICGVHCKGAEKAGKIQ